MQLYKKYIFYNLNNKSLIYNDKIPINQLLKIVEDYFKNEPLYIKVSLNVSLFLYIYINKVFFKKNFIKLFDNILILAQVEKKVNEEI